MASSACGAGGCGDSRPSCRVAHATVRTLDDHQVLYTSGVEFLDVPDFARLAIERYLERAGTFVMSAEHGEIH